MKSKNVPKHVEARSEAALCQLHLSPLMLEAPPKRFCRNPIITTDDRAPAPVERDLGFALASGFAGTLFAACIRGLFRVTTVARYPRFLSRVTH